MMNEQIDPKLSKELDALRDVSARDPQLAARGRAAFLSQAVVARDQAVSVGWLARLKKWFDKSQQPKEKNPMTTFASILAVLALVFGGGAGTVYAAQAALPNDTLYPVKLYSEAFQMNMAGEPEDAFQLALQFALRRGDEIEALVDEGVEPTAENMLQLAQQTQLAVQLAGELDGGAKLQVQNMIQNQMQRMLNLQENASAESAMLMEQTRTALQMQLMQAGGAVEDPVQNQTQEQNQQQQGPEETPGQGGPNEAPGQEENQGEPQGQGPAEDSGKPETVPGAGSANENEAAAHVNASNEGEDPCLAYYASLAAGVGQGSGNGKGSQGDSQGPVVYGLNGEVCATPTVEP